MHEVRLLPAPVRLDELGLVDRGPEQELELVAQMRAHNLRARRW